MVQRYGFLLKKDSQTKETAQNDCLKNRSDQEIKPPPAKKKPKLP